MRKIVQFFQEVKTEFKNISWPKKAALFELTFVVISISIIISLILGGFDYLFTKGIALLGQPATNSQKSIIVPTGTVGSTPTPLITLKPTIKNIKK